MLHFIARRRRCLIAASPAQGRGELDEVAGISIAIRVAFCIYLASWGAERGVLAVFGGGIYTAVSVRVRVIWQQLYINFL